LRLRVFSGAFAWDALLPLVIYPAVLLADLMAIASPGGLNLRRFEDLVSAGFVLGSLFYPVTVFICLGFKKRRSLRIAAIPLWHLGLVLLLGVVWYGLG
jgi:hypothetical protein